MFLDSGGEKNRLIKVNPQPTLRSPLLEQPSSPGQRSFSDKEFAFVLEDTGSLARHHYPVLTLLTGTLVTFPEVLLPRKVDLGLELILWTQAPISFPSASSNLETMPSQDGGMVLLAWAFWEELYR